MLKVLRAKKPNREEEYIECIRFFGVFPILCLLEEYELNEDYKECRSIMYAIEETQRKYDKVNYYIKVPTHISEFTKEDYIKTFDKGDRDKILENLESYIDQIKTEVNGLPSSL